ncbi:UNVERIFIED_CONTAM: Cytosolic sulfotransferase 15 [Sesamum latifolium]|uniref:Sulfotransferase n=1 Tax=Sesamum latifolium TaxID=2727402 RepID=A0AAW2X2N1_9LAMI
MAEPVNRSTSQSSLVRTQAGAPQQGASSQKPLSKEQVHKPEPVNKITGGIFIVAMEKKEEPQRSSAHEVDDDSPKDEFQELLQTLEQVSCDGLPLLKYYGCWVPIVTFRMILAAQKHFKAKDTDIILSTMPKSGTTWLKALTFSIANRHRFTIDQSPLLTSSPHTLVPFLDLNVYWDQENPDLENIPRPRIFSTHMHFKMLPHSIHETDCRTIYLCRNPLDQFVSYIHFSSQNEFGKGRDLVAIDEAFDMYCRGMSSYGPFWDDILGYWNAHLENPGKVLFLKYEDLKEDITSQVKKIAEFIGFPFSLEEEEQGLIDQISGLCSFESLRNLAVNKTGDINGVVKHASFFRKGQVGDWTNYLTPAMAERMKQLMDSKFEGSGLMFKT